MKSVKRGLAAILAMCLLLSNLPLVGFAADLAQPTVSVCGSTIVLTWESTEDAEQYLLERKETSSGTYEQIAATSDTEYTDSGLNLGTVYYYRLRVLYSDGSYSSYTAGKYAKTDYLEQTVGLSGTYSGGVVTLSWDAVEGAEKYIVYSVDSDGAYTKLGITAATSYTDSTVESDAAYQYSVRAYYIDGTSYRYGAYADVISVETTTTLGTPVQPNVSVCGSTITVTWDSVEGAEYYLLERKETADGTYEQITSTTDLSYVDTGLALGTVYYYRLRVSAGEIYSTYTAGKYAKTDYLEQTVGLSGTYNSGVVTLSWDAVEGAEKYIVYSVDSDGAYTKLGITAATSYTDSTVESNAAYQYSVRAYYIDGTSYRYGAYSDIISVDTTTTLGTPVQPNVSVCGSTITVTWDSVEGAELYLLERRETADGTYEQIASTTDLSYVDTGLALGTVYYYRLRVSAGDVYSTYTAGKYAKTDYLEQVTDLAAAASGTGILLTWTAVTGAEGYVVYRVDEEGTYTKLGQSTTTSYTDTTVTTDESYQYAVRAYYIDETAYRYGAYSDVVAASASLLSAPETISATVNGRQATLSWTAVTGANGYAVERREGTDGTYEEIATTSDTLFEEELEQLDTVYYYRVRAYRVLDSGEKDYGTYTAGQYVKTAYLDAPTQFQGVLSGATVTFTWTAVDNATGYIIYYSTTEDGTYEKVGQTTELTYTQRKLSLDTTYYYHVCAYYETEDGNYKISAASETIVIVTYSSSQVYYDVTDFGADGTDTASDETAIQNALDMATAIDDVVTVYIPAGTYYLDATLKIYSNTLLELDAEAVIVRNDESLFMLTSKDETGEENGGYEQFSNITIRGGTWDGNASGDVMRSLFYLYHGDGVVIEDTVLKNCCGTHHVELVGVKNATVTGVTFKDFVYCSTVDYSSLLNDDAIATADDDSADTTDDDGADATDDSDEEDSEEEDTETYDGNSAEALQLDYCSEETSNGAIPFDYTPCVNITVTGCTFENVLNGVGNHHGDAVSENIVIQNNTFIDIKNSCINLDATDGYTITGNTAEDMRGFLFVLSSSGTVSENYVDAGNSTEKAAGNLIEVSCASVTSIVVPDSYIEVSQNELYNAGTCAVRIKNGASAVITNNTISACGTAGIYADSESTVTASGNTISDAGTTGMYFLDISITISGNTIQNAATAGMLLSGVTGQLEANEVYASNGNGISVTANSSLTTSNNLIQNSSSAGISVKDSQVEMNNDSLLYNSGNGISISAATVTAVGVTADANEGAGAAVSSEGSLSVTDSSCSGNATKGIWAYSYGTVVASGCTITDNGEDGASIQSNSSATISSCVICRNGWNGINVNSSYANLTNNRVTLNCSADSSAYYDIVFKTGSTGSASGNITDSRGVYCYPSLEIELTGNLITLENDYAISGLEDVYYVTGSAVEPAVTVGTLEEGTDFEVSYSNNIEAGTASVTVTGIGDYTDSLVGEFELLVPDLSTPELTCSVSGNEITLTASTEEDCAGYRFMRKAEGDSEFVLLADTAEPTYVDSVNYGVTYQYRVQIYAYDGDTEKVSDYSAVAEAEATLDTPSIASATAAGSSVTIAWDCAEGDVYYEIQRRETASGTYETIATVSGQDTYTDSGLSLATVYYYRLRAIGTNADETQYVTGYCAGKYVKTDYLEQTTGLTGEYTDGAVSLSWDAVDGAEKYVVYSVGEDGTYTKLGITASTSYTDSTVSGGSTYRYTVRAYYVDGSSYRYGAYADVISVETTGTTVTLGTPTTPSVSVCGSTITVTWDSVEGAEYYLLERKVTSSGTYEQIASTADLSYVDSGLELGTVYYYRIRAYGSGSYSSYTEDAYAKTDYLEQTTNLTGEYTDGAVRLSWDAVDGAQKYVIQSVGEDGTYTKLGVTASTSYTDSTVSSGGTYRYTVRAYYVNGSSYRYGAYADVISVETTVTLGTPTTPSVSVCGSTVTVTWDSVEGAEYYLLERKVTSSGTYEQIASTADLSYVDSGLELGTVYYYRIRAYGSGSYSSYTAGKYSKTDYLEQTTGLTGKYADGAVSLSWDAVDGAQKYVVYSVGEDGTYTKLGQTASTSYTDSTVSSGGTYRYTVRAYYVDGSSYRYGAYADVISVETTVTLGTPTTPSVSVCGSTVTVTWDSVEGAEYYLLERKETSSGTYEQIATTTELSYVDSGLELGTVYYYRIRAYGSGSYSSYTAGKYSKTDYLEQTTGLTGEYTNGAVSLSWDAVDGAQKYIVYSVGEDGTYTKLGITASTSYTDSTVSSGGTYRYTVRAYYVDGSSYRYGAYADVISVET